MKRKILQLFAVVLGSIWFFPFNCIAALTVGTILIANMGNQEFEKSVRVRSSFSVVVEPGDNGRPFSQEIGEKYSLDEYHDGENTIGSRYRATQTEISPLTSHMSYFGYMFTAYPFSLGIALLLYGIGIFLRKKFRYVPAQSSSS